MAKHKDEGERARNALEQGINSFGETSAELAQDAGRVVQATAEASAEVSVGAARVVTDLLGDLGDSLARPERGESADADDDMFRQFNRTLSKVARSVNNAVGESARVVQRGVDRFAKVYDEENKEPAAKRPAPTTRPAG